MAKLTVTPPPQPIGHTFTLVLDEEEAMHVWAALGPSSAQERWLYCESNLKRKFTSNVDAAYELYTLLDDVFRLKGGHI